MNKEELIKTHVRIIALGFRVNTMGLLEEICQTTEKNGVLFVPLNTFKSLLAKVAQRATEINDPQLNILMLALNLYEVKPEKIVEAIEKQYDIIEDLKQLSPTDKRSELIEFKMWLWKRHDFNIANYMVDEYLREKLQQPDKRSEVCPHEKVDTCNHYKLYGCTCNKYYRKSQP